MESVMTNVGEQPTGGFQWPAGSKKAAGTACRLRQPNKVMNCKASHVSAPVTIARGAGSRHSAKWVAKAKEVALWALFRSTALIDWKTPVILSNRFAADL